MRSQRRGPSDRLAGVLLKGCEQELDYVTRETASHRFGKPQRCRGPKDFRDLPGWIECGRGRGAPRPIWPERHRGAQAHPIEMLLGSFWGPIPWMIEVAAALSAVVRHRADLAIILTLLMFNAAVGFCQEHQAGNAIEELKNPHSAHPKLELPFSP
jgi:hypothetical protein